MKKAMSEVRDQMGRYDMNSSNRDGGRPDDDGPVVGAAATELSETVSALVDGELQGAEFALAVEALSRHGELRAAWHAYHLVGDVLREGKAAGSGADPAFAARIAARLAAETPAWAANSAATAPSAIKKEAEEEGPTSVVTQKPLPEAANNPVFRWKLVAGVATLVALGSVGWNLLEAGRPSAPAATLAQAQPPQLIRDPRLDELLAAHEQSGSISALQMPAGFLRNATFGGRSR